MSRWLSFAAAASLVAVLSACGGSSDSAPAAGGGGGGAVVPPATAAAAITAAAAVAANDAATTPTSAFTVLQDAGIPPVTVNSPPKVSFTVISDGAVVKDLTLSNVAFIIARLDRGTNGEPDQWVSYTTRTETAAADVGPGGVAALPSATQATTDTEAEGSLVYNDAGYYTYTFSTDITADAGYDASKTHRVAIQLSYTNAAGTTVRVNPYFDFTIDAGGNAVAVTDSSMTRKVVDITSCNECHKELGLHGGGRVDTQYCVLCHNPSTTDANSGIVVDMKIMAHKIHAGEHLKELFGESYTIWGYRDTKHDYAEVKFPQDLRNCTKCHDNTKAAQADNWKSVPSKEACGACHAGINFATGAGATIYNAETDAGNSVAPGTTQSGHIGGAQADNSKCNLCHSAANIPTYHATEYATPNNPLAKYAKSHYPLQQGDVPQFEYKISKATINASNQVVYEFQVLIDGTPVELNDPAAATEPITGYTSGARIAYALGEAQDGFTAPSDWTTYVYANFNDVWAGLWGNSMTLTDAATKTYTAVLASKSATTSLALPATAKVVNAIIYRGFTNTTSSQESPALPAMLAAAGNTPDGKANVGRRVIFSEDKCNVCHERLGSAPNFHSGRYSTAICAMCHTPNRGGSAGWSASFRVWVHGIHGAAKRTIDFTWHDMNYQNLAYPQDVKNCKTCHLDGTYDFSASQYTASVLDNMLPVVAVRGTFDVTGTDVPKDADGNPAYGIVNGVNYGLNGASTNLVSSPIAAVCSSCHDSDAAISHMKTTGNGSVYDVRGTPAVGATAATGALAKTEQCLFCHGPGKSVPIAAAHGQ